MWMMQTLTEKVNTILFPPVCFGCKNSSQILCDKCLSSCNKALDTPYPFITSLYSFRSPLVRKAIHAIKYFHRRDVLEPFAEKISTFIKDKALSGILVPIPMHRFRKLLRGYNHSEKLAERIAFHTQLPFSIVLSRNSYLKQQVKMKTRKQRLQSQHNSFKLLKNVRGGTFILIDDVTTTGATLLEARKVLKENGALSVRAITIAH